MGRGSTLTRKTLMFCFGIVSMTIVWIFFLFFLPTYNQLQKLGNCLRCFFFFFWNTNLANFFFYFLISMMKHWLILLPGAFRSFLLFSFLVSSVCSTIPHHIYSHLCGFSTAAAGSMCICYIDIYLIVLLLSKDKT